MTEENKRSDKSRVYLLENPVPVLVVGLPVVREAERETERGSQDGETEQTEGL